MRTGVEDAVGDPGRGSARGVLISALGDPAVHERGGRAAQCRTRPVWGFPASAFFLPDSPPGLVSVRLRRHAGPLHWGRRDAGTRRSLPGLGRSPTVPERGRRISKAGVGGTLENMKGTRPSPRFPASGCWDRALRPRRLCAQGPARLHHPGHGSPLPTFTSPFPCVGAKGELDGEKFDPTLEVLLATAPARDPAGARRLSLKRANKESAVSPRWRGVGCAAPAPETRDPAPQLPGPQSHPTDNQSWTTGCVSRGAGGAGKVCCW